MLLFFAAQTTECRAEENIFIMCLCAIIVSAKEIDQIPGFSSKLEMTSVIEL